MAAKDAANQKGALFQIHVAETKQEHADTLKKHGVSPVRYLDTLGVLDENTLAVHAVWADETDIRMRRRYHRRDGSAFAVSDDSCPAGIDTWLIGQKGKSGDPFKMGISG